MVAAKHVADLFPGQETLAFDQLRPFAKSAGQFSTLRSMGTFEPEAFWSLERISKRITVNSDGDNFLLMALSPFEKNC
jgi:hypothetical protein